MVDITWHKTLLFYEGVRNVSRPIHTSWRNQKDKTIFDSLHLLGYDENMAINSISSIDFLYISLASGFLIISIVTAYTIYQFADLLKKFKSIVQKISGIVSDISNVENTIKVGIYNLFYKIIHIFIKEDKNAGK